MYCLGLKALGTCRYDAASPSSVYLSLGDVLAALGLLLAFTQLASPHQKLRAQIRPMAVRSAVCLFLAAFLCALIGSLLPQTPFKGVVVVGYPIAWELAGSVSILAGALTLAHVLLTPARLSAQNVDRYLSTIAKWITRGTDVSLTTVAVELEESVPTLVRLTHEHGSASPLWWSSRRSSAVKLVALLVEARMIKTILSHTPETAVAFVKARSVIAEPDPAVDSMVKALVIESVTSKESILAKEITHRALGIPPHLTSALFGHYRDSDGFDPLRHLNRVDITSDLFKQYSSAVRESVISGLSGSAEHDDSSLSIALTVYSRKAANALGFRYQLSDGREVLVIDPLTSALSAGLGEEEKYARAAFRSELRGEDNNASLYDVLRNVSGGFAIVLSSTMQAGNVSETSAARLQPVKINQHLVKLLFQYLRFLSDLPLGADLVVALAPVAAFFDGRPASGPVLRQALAERAQAELDDCEHSGNVWFVRVALHLMALSQPDLWREKNTSGTLEVMMRWLGKNYHALYEENADNAKAMLPMLATYDPQSGKLHLDLLAGDHSVQGDSFELTVARG